MGLPMMNVMAAFLLSRILCFLFVYMGHMNRDFLSPIPGGWKGVENWWLNPWTTYDSQWFMDIAINGYSERVTPFFPLYPVLLKVAGENETVAALAGFVISNACFLAALLIVYRLTSMDFNEKTATLTVWLLAFFPTAAFFSAVYTESLFLLLLAGSFYLARRGYWLGAGCAGLLAALTRNPGLLITIALAMEYFRSTGEGECRPGAGAMAGVLMPVTGFTAVQVYFWNRFGGPFSGVTSQEFYYRALAWPWEPVIKDLADVFTLRAADPVTLLNVMTVMAVFAFAVRYRSILRHSYTVLMLGVILMHLVYARTIPPYTIGAVRYMSSLFPFAQLVALSTNNLSRYIKLFGAAAYLFVFATFSYYFGLKIFLG